MIMRMLPSLILLFILLVLPVKGVALEQVPSQDGSSLKEQKVSLNFVDVELPVLAKFISEVTGKNFLFDEKFKGKVTIIAPSPLKIEDAFRLFTSVLELKGYTVVPSGVNVYKIMPATEARQKGLEIATAPLPVNDTYIVRLVKLNNISSKDAVKFLRPVVSKDGHISEFSSGNLLLLIDSASNIKKLLEIIETIDTPSTVQMPEIVFLKHAPAEEVAKILNEGFGSPVTRFKTPIQGSMFKAVADRRLNAVVLFGPANLRESMKKLISMLDIPSPEDQGRINVYFLENADAEEIAEVLNGIVKGIRSKETAKKSARKKSLEITGDIIITPDKATNSLIIVASPSDYRNLVEVIKKLDRRRRQVYVEAMIIEASIDKLKEIGARWRMIGRREGEPVVIGGVGILDPNAIQSIIYGLTGLSAGGLGNFMDIPVTRINSDGTVTTTNLTVPGFAALFSLEEFRGAVNILSTPQILTSDNEEAEIVVGENVPFITKRESDPTRTVSVFTTIERKDVGITLRIKPQITEGDYVRLDIYQEISAVKQEPNTEILISVGPTTTKRSTSTSVVVKDNQTVVIGGLMQEKEEEIVNKVPLLGDIPILGLAFRTKSISKKKTNLLVFLTPHIVRDAESLRELTEKKRRDFVSQHSTNYQRQILLRFKPDIDKNRAEEIIKAGGARIVKHLKGIDIYLIEAEEDRDPASVIEHLNSLPEVEYAEPNYPFRVQ